MMKNKILSVILALLVLILSACTPTTTPAPGAAGTPAATLAPTLTLTEIPDPNRVTFGDTSFMMTLVNGAESEDIAENPGTQDGPYWEVHPAYQKITLHNYPLAKTFFEPTISVYPVADYRRLSADAGAVLDSLAQLLEEEPSQVEGYLPYLPPVNAGQVFHSNLKYLDFQSGRGLRYLTLYAQYPAPINNFELFYTFQGLSADGSRFISIVLPVSHPSLPADANAVSQADMETIAQDPAAYYTRIADELSAQPEDSFTPSLADLDALVESLNIE